MVKLCVLNLCVFGLIIRVCQSANILVLEGTPSPSHHVWMRTLMIELAHNGHNVTSISPDVDKKSTPNLHYIYLENAYRHLYKGGNIDFVSAGEMSSFSAIFFYATFCLLSCEGALLSQGIQVLMDYPADFQFDLVIHENLLSPCLIGFLHRFGYPPLIHATPFHTPALSAHWVGSQMQPYVIPYYRTSDSETFLGRVKNYSLFFIEYFVRHFYVLPKMDALSQVAFPGAPTIAELERQVKLVLMNSHPVNEIVEPLLPNVIPVGGLQVQNPDDLPEDLKQIADAATNGLVLFSLGTNARSDMLSNKSLRYILEAFTSFPTLTFLWKFESDQLPIEKPPNVHIRSWIPQTEILAHKNTVLFVTHSGLLSTQEALWYGVPMLCLPVFADQKTNSIQIQRTKAAEVIPVASLNSTNLKYTMEKIINNLSVYRANSARLSRSFRDQPELPLKRAVWWIEWLLRNPDTEYLNSPARYLNIFSRHAIDVILFLFVIFCATLYATLKLGALIANLLKNSNQNIKIKKT